MLTSELRDAIKRQRPGWSLEQQFYVSPEIYELERRGWLARQWLPLGHCSEVPEPGSYIVRELLGESLIIVRGKDGLIRGFHNVCRHRGSRICDRDGKTANFTCPYHGWSYRLDGSLRSAPAMSPDIDLSKLGLHPAPVREIGGLIIGSLQGDLRSLDAVQREVEPALHHKRIPQARIAARRSYPTAGNWKLVMENFHECYHCLPAHPEYCSAMTAVVNMIARVPTKQEAVAWNEHVTRWLREEADANFPVTSQLFQGEQGAQFRVSREPIGGGRKTQSADGAPIAPLMGQVSRFDGSVAYFDLWPLIVFTMLNDHAVLFQFLPAGPESTDVIITWLVDGSAAQSEVDVERMVWLWDVTTLQDKKIIENNAAGIRSLAYTPGPYSTVESSAMNLVNDYLRGMAAHCDGNPD